MQLLPRPSFHEALRRRDKGAAQEGPAAANRAAHLRAEATAAMETCAKPFSKLDLGRHVDGMVYITVYNCITNFQEPFCIHPFPTPSSASPQLLPLPQCQWRD